jgi:spore maturation protein SpmA/spore maturation protein SpmB
MLNYIWLVLIVTAVLLGGVEGKIGDVGQAAIDSAKTAVTLAAGLVAIMTLWLGLMRLAEKAGLIRQLGLALKPIMLWLFPEVPANHPAMGSIVLNVAANILGLNNAATPLGLRAMSELNLLNRRPGVATNAMCMLLAINTSSITLIPVTAIGLLLLYHGKNAYGIIGTSLAATVIAHAAAIITCKLLERSPWYRLPPLTEQELAAAPPVETGKGAEAGREIEETALKADETLPWVPGSKWILCLVAGIFLGLWLGTSFLWFSRGLAHTVIGSTFPSLDTFAQTQNLNAPPRHFYLRMVDALSLLVIPGLILFFPLYATLRRIPVYEEFVEGGKEGFNVILRILPYVVGMLMAIGMFSAAGGMAMVTWVLHPVTDLLHFPAELVPMAVIRPFSYAAALGLLTDIVKDHGADSMLALTGATLYGCSETTFYVIAVYFGSVNIRRTRHAIPAGLVADVVGPIASVIICRAVFG